MNHDGVKAGFANEALARLAEELTIPDIASGGAGCKEHFRDAFAIGHADAALAASVFHFGEIGIPELKEYLRAEKINVRLCRYISRTAADWYLPSFRMPTLRMY